MARIAISKRHLNFLRLCQFLQKFYQKFNKIAMLFILIFQTIVKLNNIKLFSIKLMITGHIKVLIKLMKLLVRYQKSINYYKIKKRQI